MYAVIQIPVFPLQALLRQLPRRPKGPIAVLDEYGEQSYILTANKVARQFEVSEGMHPARALARCANLQLIPRSGIAEKATTRILHLLAQTVSPRIEETDAGLVTIDLRGAAEQSRQTELEHLVERFRSVGLFVRIGVAGTPDHALWAAYLAKWIKRVRWVDPFLNQLPVAVTGIPQEVIEIFAGWGIHSLGAIKRLPREEVGARLGKSGLDLWDAVSGTRSRLLKPFKTDPQFFRKLELDYRIESLEALLFILKRFIDELALELRIAHQAAFGFNLYLKLENKRIQETHIEVPIPSGRASTLFRILETALENMQTQDAIVGVHLRLDTAEARARQSDLFAVAMEDAVGFGETADRIAALVGPNRSGSPRVNDTWRPDAFRIEKLDTEIQTDIDPDPQKTSIGLPLERMRPPKAIRVFMQDEQPAALESEVIQGIVKQVHGPWRFSSDWWDNKPWSREEWDIELEAGGLYRIFRTGKGWFLEGMYG